ncbi:IclR family transcriptional regulator [Nonomuraea sp. NPDC026600]|uniref:IclR family transcriptional regulator n=1 Tax=Nonomuraea sp. NPDC026600 TaxID=3155363 RepID=UPI0033F163BF
MRNKPAYLLESVDNALRLLQLLRDHGRLRVSEAADELGIARSSAHRLLSMLVYRDFATRDDQRGYLPGPGLAAAPIANRTLQVLRHAMLPHMEMLCSRVDETVNLLVRIGTQTRFLASVESTQVLHVGDRQGTVLPARKTSGGKALLAELDRDELAEMYGNDEDFPRLCRELELTKRQGYALNLEDTETGVAAMGRCVTDRTGHAVAALTISIPTVRFGKERVEPLAAELRDATERAGRNLPPL